MTPLVTKTTRIYLAGHTGLVGGAILRALHEAGYENLVVRDLDELDLTDQHAAHRFFAEERPQVVIVAAAKVGGILANWEQPWEFVDENLAIELNVIGEALPPASSKLIFLGSSCIYPREAPQPLKEEYLLTGPLEETNRAYAIAKIAGIELCRSLNREYGTDYLSLMPTNLYGPGDNFDLRTQPRAAGPDPQVPRGQGRAGEGGGAQAGPRRSPSGAPARRGASSSTSTTSAGPSSSASSDVQAADVPDGMLNVGCGEDLTIRELAELVQRVVGHAGPIVWDDDASPTARRASSWT